MTTINAAVTTDTTVTSATPAQPAAPAAAAAPARRALVDYAPDSFGVSNADAMRELLRARQKGVDLDAVMKRAANKAELGAKTSAVKLTAQQIHGEQVSAVQGLASKLLATGVQAGAGAKGTRMRNSGDDAQRARGAGLDSAAQGGALGNVVTSASDMTDKLAGGAHQADQAKIDLKQNEVELSLASQQKDGAKASYDRNLKGFDEVLDSIKSQVSRWAEVIIKLT